MKHIITVLICASLVLSCAKQKLQPAKPADAVKAPSQEEIKKETVTANKPAEKPVVTEVEGSKKVTPEDIKTESISKAQTAGTLEDELLLPHVIHFDFDSYELKQEARAILQDVAAFLKANSGLNVTVEGHCDERGTREYNLALGMKRAEAAKKYLIDLGIDSARLGVTSFGKDKPLAKESTEDAWAKNRRAQFRKVK